MFKFEKKSQIAVFIIIGIIIVFTIVFMFYISSIIGERKIEEEVEKIAVFDTYSIEQHVQSCVENMGEASIRFFGLNGGFIMPEDYHMIGDQSIAYLLDYEENKLRSEEEIETELSGFMDIIMTFCTDFTVFEEVGYEITEGDVSTKTRINENKVLFDVSYPITIKKGDLTAEISDFKANIPIRLGHILNVVNEIIEEQKEHPDLIPISDLVRYDVNITVIKIHEQDKYFYSIADEPRKGMLHPYYFQFMTRYGEE